jgi:D-alanyl-D-alanine carboxypeptidase (penicillin-binding protein 5/6)
MKRQMRLVTAFVLAVALVLSCTAEAASPKKTATKPHTVAKDPYLGAIVLDADTGRVLFEDNADAKGYPASVLKLMLMLITMEKVEQGKLDLKDPVPVSVNAVGIDGANLKLAEGETFPLEDMLYALMIHSANDVAVAVAEKLAGSVEGYVSLINRRAQALGMGNSEFHSPNGLGPKPGNPYDVTTARDLSLMCREILKHEQVLRFTSAQEWVFRPDGGKKRITMQTHNYLLDEVKGCDGLKTGYIGAAGYNIAATAKRQGQRVIAIVLGATSEESRNKIAARLIGKGFAALGVGPTTAR